MKNQHVKTNEKRNHDCEFLKEKKREPTVNKYQKETTKNTPTTMQKGSIAQGHKLKNILKGLLFLLLLISSCFGDASSDATGSKFMSFLRGQGGFMKGASTHMKDEQFKLLRQYLGGNAVRVYVQWRYVQQKLDIVDSTLRVENLRELYQKNISALDEYMDTLNWVEMDNMINSVLSYNFTYVIVEIGEGTKNCLPIYQDPNMIGEQVYLAYQYRFCRSVVRRYKSKGIYLYQTENELNEAWLSGFGGQRTSHISGSWKKWDFLTDLLKTLRQAVKDEDPNALTTMNFHTDISQTFHRELLLKGYYEDAVVSWHQYMDFVSLDAYPNMYISSPILSSMIKDRVSNIRKIIGPEKAIIVMETGYPILNDTIKVPDVALNFTEEMAAEYVKQSFQAVRDASGNGYIYFNIEPTNGMVPPDPSGYTEKDVEAMKMISKVYEESSTLEFIKWLFHEGNLDYLMHRLPEILSSVQKGWGIIKLNGQMKPIICESIKNTFRSAI